MNQPLIQGTVLAVVVLTEALIDDLRNVELLHMVIQLTKVPDQGQHGHWQRLDTIDQMPHRNIAQFLLCRVNVGVEAKTGALKTQYGSFRVLPVRVARGDELQACALVQALAIQLMVAHDFFDSSDSLR